MTNESPLPPAVQIDTQRWNRQYLVAILLLGSFAVLVAVMVWLATGSDTVWQRRVYVFGAVQAIVFTAVGWLFGREGTAAARDDAQAARDEATAAREAAQQEALEAATFRVDVVRAAVRHSLPTGAVETGARDAGPQSVKRTAVDLDAFMTDLFGPPR
jgi:hypothetical protein